MKRRTAHYWIAAFVTAAVANAFGTAAQAQVPCRYEVSYWPNVDCGFGPNPGNPVAVNDSGHVCARWTSCGDPVPLTLLWTGGPTTQVLPIPPGYVGMQPEDMNNAGEIVGELYTASAGSGQPIAFFRSATGTVTPLIFPPDVNASWATSINNHSQVAGYCNTPGGYRPFIWENGVLTMLAVPAGSYAANDINDSGQVVLWRSNSEGYVWTNSKLEPIGFLSGGSSLRPRSIAPNGAVVGSGTVPDARSPFGFVHHAFLYRNGQIADLGLLPGTVVSFAYANNDNVIVGSCASDSEGFAFDFVNGKMRRLSQLQSNPNLSLHIANALSSSGLIAANGRIGNSHVGVLLTPVLGPLGDINSDCRVGVPDLLAIINSWGACDANWFCPSDLTNDNVVNVWDIIEVIEYWGQQS